MYSDKLTGDNLKYQEQSALQLYQDLSKNLKSKGVIQKVEIRNIITYEFNRNGESSGGKMLTLFWTIKVAKLCKVK